MPDFKVLLLKEHINGKVNEFDNNIIILYDSEEETYYYYGSRNVNSGKYKYKDYKGTFHNSQFAYFMNFLNYLFGLKMDVFELTTELHHLHIGEDEYDMLNFVYLYEQLDNRNTMAAYDYDNVSVCELQDMLLMIA